MLVGIREEVNLTRQWHPINHSWEHAATATQDAYARVEGQTIRDAQGAAASGQPTRASWHTDIDYQALPDGVGPARLTPHDYFPNRYDLEIQRLDESGAPLGVLVGQVG